MVNSLVEPEEYAKQHKENSLTEQEKFAKIMGLPPEEWSLTCDHVGTLGYTDMGNFTCSNCGKSLSKEEMFDVYDKTRIALVEAKRKISELEYADVGHWEELQFTREERDALKEQVKVSPKKYKKLRKERDKLQAEVKELKDWKAKYLMSSRCWYCGERLGFDTPNHWAHCSEHPARVRVEELERENAFLERKLKVSYVNERDFENLTGENEELRLELAELKLSQCDCESLRDDIGWWTKQCDIWKNKYERYCADCEALRLENILLKLELADESKCCSNCAKRDWCEVKLVAKRVFLRDADEFCCSVREPVET